MEEAIQTVTQQVSHGGFDLHDVLAFLLAAVIVVPIFRRFKFSSVLGYLAAGAIIGPHGLAVIDDVEGSELVAELGVVFLLFTIGLELSLDRLKAMRRNVFGLGFAQVFVSMAAIAGVGYYLLKLPMGAAVIVGGALALSSTAFVLQLLTERGELTTRFGQAAFAILLFQDLAVVPMLAMTQVVGTPDANLFEVLGLAMLKATAAIVVIMLLGRTLLRPIYKTVAVSRSPEVFTAMTLLLVLGTGYATLQAGLSMALGAFLAGLLLSESEYRHQVEADISPFKGVLLGLFFITVGMHIDFGILINQGQTVLLLVFGLMLLKAALLLGLMKGFRFDGTPSLRVAVLLSQGGEFAFVILNQAVPQGIVPEDIGTLLFVVVAISMVLTPFLVLACWHITGRLDKSLNTRLEWLAEKTEGLSDHVVVAGFGRVGRTVGEILTAQGVPFIALEIDASRVAQGRAQAMPVYYGDAALAEVLRAVGSSRAKAMVLTMDNPRVIARSVTTIRLVFPEVDVYVRARDSAHVRELEHIGATATVPETLEASLQLGAAVLRSFGQESDEVVKAIDQFRRDIISDQDDSKATLAKAEPTPDVAESGSADSSAESSAPEGSTAPRPEEQATSA